MPLPSNFVETYGPWAVVTGASSGIGKQFALRLAAIGLSVALVAPEKDLLYALSAHIKLSHPVQTRVIIANFCTDAGWRSVVSATSDLDVGLLVNNAGVSLVGSFFRDPIEKHLNMISINTDAVTALAHSIGHRIADRGRGGIIFTSSVSRRMVPWVATYSATKAFVSSLALLLRHELRPRGVQVLVLEPARIQTGMSAKGSPTAVSRIWGLGGRMMLPSECVDEALTSLAADKARCTPGFGYKIVMFMLSLLPTSFRFWLEDVDLRRTMNPALLTYT